MKRKIWMVPKNIRRIPPWKLIQILNIFNSASTDREWDSHVKKMLEQKSLKRDFGSYDKNPGGDRTYKSQLVCLGMIYDDEEGNIQFTKAGRDLVSGHDEPLLILQNMLLRLQYPSAYSIGLNVDLSHDVTVRPFLFLLQLMSELEYLTKPEMSVAIIYGHDHEQSFTKVISKIRRLRSGSSFIDVLDANEDIWTSRIKNKSIDKRINYVHDISNIFQNYLVSARLIERNKEDGVYICRLTGLSKDFINNSSNELIETEIEEIKQNKISFQRRFGAWDGKKDTVRIPEQSEPIRDPEELIIRNEFIEFLSKGIRDETDYDYFREKMCKLGLSEYKINSVITKLDSQNTPLFEDRFQYIATSGGKYAGEFEEAIVRLLKKIGLNAYHTGNMRRTSGSGGYADAYAVSNDEAFLFDAKASEYYSLSHSDLSKACQTYIPNWSELVDTHDLPRAKVLELFCYIAGGYKTTDNLEARLSEIRDKADTNASALIAWDFYKYVQKNPECSVEDFLTKIKSGGRVYLN